MQKLIRASSHTAKTLSRKCYVLLPRNTQLRFQSTTVNGTEAPTLSVKKPQPIDNNTGALESNALIETLAQLKLENDKLSEEARKGRIDNAQLERAQQLFDTFARQLTSSEGKVPIDIVRQALCVQFDIDSMKYFKMKRHLAEKPKELLALCNRLLEYEPDIRSFVDTNVWYYRFTDVYFTRALCYLALAKFEYALESFNFMIDKRLKPLLQHPEVKEDAKDSEMLENYYKQSLKNRYSIYLELNKLDKALGDVSKYNELYPGDDESTFHLAKTHQRLGQLGPALDAAKKLLSAHTDREWRLKGKQLLALIIREHFDKGTEESQKHALTICNNLIQEYPYEQELYLSRAYLLDHLGQIDRALADTDQYLTLGGRPLLTLELRTGALVKLGRCQIALTEIDSMLADWNKISHGLAKDVADKLEVRIKELRNKVGSMAENKPSNSDK